MNKQAKRAVEHRLWKWVDGMRNQEGYRFCGAGGCFVSYDINHWTDPGPFVEPLECGEGGDEPDTEDPATLRLMLEILREQEGYALACVQEFNSGKWIISTFLHSVELCKNEHLNSFGETEVEAILRAWDAVENER